MSYTRIIVCIVVHSDCRFQQWLFLSSFHPQHLILHCISRQGLDTFYRLYRSVKWICIQVISLRQRGARVTVFCSKWYRIWKHWTWEPYKQCYLSASFIVFEWVDATHLLSSGCLQASKGLRLYANTVPYYFPLMDAVGRQVISKVADHYYKHS